jgi:primary-amine oxidase
MPNKADILPLLNGSDGNPVRHALVAIMFGATEKPYMQEFTVGPLPITNSSILKPFTSWNNDGGDGKYRVDNPDNTEYSKFNLASMKEAEDITKFLWNLVSIT